MRGFYVMPLTDEEGRVGILSFESSDPHFLNDVHFEMIKVLAGQATVALRNASLYQEVPFIGILEPLIQKKAKFMALPGRRRAAILTLVATGAIFLGAFPAPMRVDGGAVAAPARTAQIERLDSTGTVWSVPQARRLRPRTSAPGNRRCPKTASLPLSRVRKSSHGITQS
jgi:hypothetical protein